MSCVHFLSWYFLYGLLWVCFDRIDCVSQIRFDSDRLWNQRENMVGAWKDTSLNDQKAFMCPWICNPTSDLWLYSLFCQVWIKCCWWKASSGWEGCAFIHSHYYSLTHCSLLEITFCSEPPLNMIKARRPRHRRGLARSMQIHHQVIACFTLEM